MAVRSKLASGMAGPRAPFMSSSICRFFGSNVPCLDSFQVGSSYVLTKMATGYSLAPCTYLPLVILVEKALFLSSSRASPRVDSY